MILKLIYQITSKRIKYLGINLTKEVKDLYSENYKTLMREIEDERNRWKDISYSRIGGTNVVKMSIVPKAIYRLMQNPYQITNSILPRVRTNNSKLDMETKKTRNSQNNWRYHTHCFQTILQSYSHQNSMVLV